MEAKCEKDRPGSTEDGSLVTICNGLLRVFAMDGGAGMGFAAENLDPEHAAQLTLDCSESVNVRSDADGDALHVTVKCRRPRRHERAQAAPHSDPDRPVPAAVDMLILGERDAAAGGRAQVGRPPRRAAAGRGLAAVARRPEPAVKRAASAAPPSPCAARADDPRGLVGRPSPAVRGGGRVHVGGAGSGGRGGGGARVGGGQGGGRRRRWQRRAPRPGEGGRGGEGGGAGARGGRGEGGGVSREIARLKAETEAARAGAAAEGGGAGGRRAPRVGAAAAAKAAAAAAAAPPSLPPPPRRLRRRRPQRRR